MTRELLERSLLFIVPFVIYGIYLITLRMRAATPTHRHPWAGLLIAGLVLVVASFIYTGLTEGESVKGVYVPPHMEHGHIVPGHVDTRKKP